MKSFLKGIKPEFAKEFEKMRSENCDVYFPQFLQKQHFLKAWLNCIFFDVESPCNKNRFQIYIYQNYINVLFAITYKGKLMVCGNLNTIWHNSPIPKITLPGYASLKTLLNGHILLSVK